MYLLKSGLIAFFLVILVNSASAQTLYLKSGKTVSGKIIEQTDDQVKLDFEGVILTYQNSEIEQIKQTPEPKPQPQLNTNDQLESNPSPENNPVSQLPEVSVQEKLKNINLIGNQQDLYKEGLDYLQAGLYQQAQEVFKVGIQRYPDTPIFYYQLGVSNLGLKNYSQAVEVLVKELNMLKRAPNQVPLEMLVSAHYELADAYNGLGLTNGFPLNLCQKIIYHIGRTLQLMPEMSRTTAYMDFLTQTFGRLELVQNNPDSVGSIELPDDGVSPEDLKKTIETAKDFLTLYQQARLPRYAVTDSDKTFAQIAEVISQDLAKIRSIHYLVTNSLESKIAVSSETFFLRPNKYKVIQPDQTLLFIDSTMSILDPKTNQVIESSPIEIKTISYLNDLCKFDLSNMPEFYQLNVAKVKESPDFLQQLYAQAKPVNLYLISAKLNNQQNLTNPPVTRVELFVDLDSKIIVARREFWRQPIGSGVYEDLGRDIVVTRLKAMDDGLLLPKKGITTIYENGALADSLPWDIEIISYNDLVENQDFGINQVTKENFFNRK